MKKQERGSYAAIATDMKAATAIRVAGGFNFIVLMALIGISSNNALFS